MKSGIKAILGFGAIFAAFWFFNQKRSLSKLIATVNNITFMNGKLVVTIRIANPSNVPITITNILGNIIINGEAVGNVNNFNQQTIAPNAFSNIDVYVGLNALGLGLLAAQIFQNGIRQSYTATFDGIIKAGALAVPVQKTMKLA